MKTNRIKWVLIVLVAISLASYFMFFKKTSDENIAIKAKRGYFKVTVTSSGELKAKNAIEIRGPSGAERLAIYQMKISKIVAEGTVVKKGDFVAELDKSEIMSKITEMEMQIQKYESQFLQARLDSSLNLSESRNSIQNLKLSLEEKKLAKEQSIYEAPAVLRQAEIAYERELRDYDQAIKNYGTKVEQAIAKLQEVGLELSMEKQNMSMLMKVFAEFTITAPADGMVIYIRDWNGSRKGEGASINSWWPVVANLPDLSVMESVTYVNEIDIQKIKKDQYVSISLDANPDKHLKGKVVKVATIGEERKNSDSKVFEVLIEVQGKDTTLLPSMTTSNEILVGEYKDVVFIPLDAVHSDVNKNKKFSFVYLRKDGTIVKQEVKLGAMNENEVIIEKGLSGGDELLLNIPKELEKIETKKLKGK